MKPHHKKRLKKLITVFKSAKKIKDGYIFDIGDNRVLFDITKWGQFRQRTAYCGTAACVAGTAGLIPEFRKAGLKTTIRETGSCVEFRGEGGEEGGEDAFAKFFGVTESDSYDICMPERYTNSPKATPREVVAKLERVLKKYGR